MTQAAADGFVRCPFCASAVGSMAKDRAHRRSPVRYFVRCDECKARGPVFFSPERAHAAWNERTYGLDHNTSPEWTQEERNGGPQVAECQARHQSERDSGESA